MISLVSLHSPVSAMKLEKEKLGDEVIEQKLRCSTLEAEISKVNREKR